MLLLRVRTAKTRGLEFRTNTEIFEFLLNTQMNFVRYVNPPQGSLKGQKQSSEGLVLVAQKYILIVR